MTITEIRRILAESDIRLTKSLGQHFLHDGNQIRRIVELAKLAAGDSVLEVGPGLGALTDALLERAARVLAIEKDRRLERHLQCRFAGFPALELVLDDAMEYVRRRRDHDWSEWKLIANLPYSVGSALLVELALMPASPARLTVTLQAEVVGRIRADAGSREYGLLSLLLQIKYVPTDWFRVPAACFFPVPEVTSACIDLERRTRPLVEGAELTRFVRIVRLGFSQRRKIMFKLLKSAWPESRLRESYEALGIDLRARAESVTLERFVGLARRLRPE